MSVCSVEPREIIPENPTIPEPSDAPLSNPIKDLFKAAMDREWETVCELYKDKKVQGEHITRANDTLLHVAVSGATEKIILDLLDIVTRNEEMSKILNLKNKAGDTPLHRAAALGLEKVCSMMIKMCPDMATSARNNLQETPLFSAVRHGKKNSFFVLEIAIHKEQNLKIDSLSLRDITHCIRQDGNNILHYAIREEQFDLAYEIIRLYPSLVWMNNVNSKGETALHTLANMPSVFKSGARFGLYDTIIYSCTTTEPLKLQCVDLLENLKNITEAKSDIQEDEIKLLPPPLYTVCIDLFCLMKDFVKCIYNTIDSCLTPGVIFTACLPHDVENQCMALKQFPFILRCMKAGAKKEDEDKPSKNQKQRRRFPPNYDVMIFFFEIIINLLGVLGIVWRWRTIAQLKRKHKYALEIMKELVDGSTLWEYKASGRVEPAEPSLPFDIRSNPSEACPTESPVLVAAKKGITEIVQRILLKLPVAIFDEDKDAKNIVLLSVEHRQLHVYNSMLKVTIMKDHLFGTVDKEGNNALHLAAKLSQSRLWRTGAALHIQWEIKWYKYVRSSMDRERSATINNSGRMPEEVFIESHDKLIKDAITGLTNTCQSCSVVAALFATVAFQSVSTVPGGVDQQSGFPILSERPAFQLFTISSLVALCFSVTSVVMFLAILISDFKIWDFERRLPVKLILGLASLFMAIVSTLVAFCAGNFYVVENNLQFSAYLMYAIMGFPVIYFAYAQYTLFINLIIQTIKKVAKPEMAQDYYS